MTFHIGHCVIFHPCICTLCSFWSLLMRDFTISVIGENVLVDYWNSFQCSTFDMSRFSSSWNERLKWSLITWYHEILYNVVIGVRFKLSAWSPYETMHLVMHRFGPRLFGLYHEMERAEFHLHNSLERNQCISSLSVNTYYEIEPDRYLAYLEEVILRICIHFVSQFVW